MDNNKVEFVFVSDRSGSMGSCREEAENAINRMIDDQRNESGKCLITFIEFDDQYDVLYDGVDLENVSKYLLKPRGMTALYDAVGKAITTVGQRLANTPEVERPKLVTVVISTDGYNNASKEYTQSQVANMIKEQTDKYSWKFVFVGVDINEDIGVQMNINPNNVVSVARANSALGFQYTSDKLKRARSASAQNMSNEQIDAMLVYNQVERDELKS